MAATSSGHDRGPENKINPNMVISSPEQQRPLIVTIHPAAYDGVAEGNNVTNPPQLSSAPDISKSDGNDSHLQPAENNPHTSFSSALHPSPLNKSRRTNMVVPAQDNVRMQMDISKTANPSRLGSKQRQYEAKNAPRPSFSATAIGWLRDFSNKQVRRKNNFIRGIAPSIHKIRIEPVLDDKKAILASADIMRHTSDTAEQHNSNVNNPTGNRGAKVAASSFTPLADNRRLFRASFNLPAAPAGHADTTAANINNTNNKPKPAKTPFFQRRSTMQIETATGNEFEFQPLLSEYASVIARIALKPLYRVITSIMTVFIILYGELFQQTTTVGSMLGICMTSWLLVLVGLCVRFDRRLAKELTTKFEFWWLLANNIVFVVATALFDWYHNLNQFVVVTKAVAFFSVATYIVVMDAGHLLDNRLKAAILSAVLGCAAILFVQMYEDPNALKHGSERVGMLCYFLYCTDLRRVALASLTQLVLFISKYLYITLKYKSKRRMLILKIPLVYEFKTEANNNKNTITNLDSNAHSPDLIENKITSPTLLLSQIKADPISPTQDVFSIVSNESQLAKTKSKSPSIELVTRLPQLSDNDNDKQSLGSHMMEVTDINSNENAGNNEQSGDELTEKARNADSPDPTAITDPGASVPRLKKKANRSTRNRIIQFINVNARATNSMTMTASNKWPTSKTNTLSKSGNINISIADSKHEKDATGQENSNKNAPGDNKNIGTENSNTNHTQTGGQSVFVYPYFVSGTLLEKSQTVKRRRRSSSLVNKRRLIKANSGAADNAAANKTDNIVSSTNDSKTNSAHRNTNSKEGSTPDISRMKSSRAVVSSSKSIPKASKNKASNDENHGSYVSVTDHGFDFSPFNSIAIMGRIAHSRLYLVFFLLYIAVVLIYSAALYAVDTLAKFIPLIIVLVFVSACELTRFDRRLLKHVVRTFEFWYLFLSICAFIINGLFSNESKGNPYVDACNYVAFGLANLYVILLDAAPGISRIGKGMFLTMLILNALRLFISNIIENPSHNDNPVCWLYCTDTRSLTLSCLLQLTIFYTKYTIKTFRYGNQFTILSLPIEARPIVYTSPQAMAATQAAIDKYNIDIDTETEQDKSRNLSSGSKLAQYQNHNGGAAGLGSPFTIHRSTQKASSPLSSPQGKEFEQARRKLRINTKDTLALAAFLASPHSGVKIIKGGDETSTPLSPGLTLKNRDISATAAVNASNANENIQPTADRDIPTAAASRGSRDNRTKKRRPLAFSFLTNNQESNFPDPIKTAESNPSGVISDNNMDHDHTKELANTQSRDDNKSNDITVISIARDNVENPPFPAPTTINETVVESYTSEALIIEPV